ncbi:glycerol-3-phosphate dehydrogenase subunit GlpB [Natrarchaeobaculum sulfurireducens]|uniref:Anaerobic glycerol-3-phosphate dehydrogenase n=1 Tax=Natrarchaeobaculum sulfurireducens TaxID=2044521 RepID=A0A346PC92_9EURY|nr:glycerol-3-phosphate dehydrogenase subunit GlpB [Natrarchaeobaculum sulfurireducens]AXR77137.1 Anaerobic glycerol-3-phosphate dehydrogenase [Natrarchaeobaculum sulfurireducens]AXR82897.1 Anaerobic glycerol-3-phosphate dehydrogenase subunit B [Natrarchaeobaculum sulfurireducens]
MAIEDDVLVIGGGLAGATAALAAAERDVRVRLVTYKQSTLRHASGLIDVLGYAPTDDGPLTNPYDALESLPDSHPYRLVGEAAIRKALAFFDELAGAAYAGSHTDANALVPTAAGTIKPTARYPTATAPGLASDRRDVLLVGFETLPGFDAPLAAAHLEAAGVPFDVRGATCSFPGIRRDDAKVTRYAHLLDVDEAIAVDAGEIGVRAALIEAVEGHLEGEARVGFPALLGDEHADEVRTDLADGLGVDVFEVPMGPPSLPGIRLEDLLYDALEDAGVRVTSGVPVVEYETAGASEDRIDHVVVDRNGAQVPHRATQYVLATGGLVGKGVQSERQRVYEPIFDCHVSHADDRYEWFVDGVFDEQPYARFGLSADGELRPLDADGKPEFRNLRAAGSVLGGYDYAAEKSGSGVSLATGYVAGTHAGEAVDEVIR